MNYSIAALERQYDKQYIPSEDELKEWITNFSNDYHDVTDVVFQPDGICEIWTEGGVLWLTGTLNEVFNVLENDYIYNSGK